MKSLSTRQTRCFIINHQISGSGIKRDTVKPNYKWHFLFTLVVLCIGHYHLSPIFAWIPCNASTKSRLFLNIRYDTSSAAAAIINRNGFAFFHRSCRRRNEQTSEVHMVSNLFGSESKQQTLPSLPRDVKEAVSRCREATQAALKDRISRMDVDFPAGTKFGIEKKPKGGSDTDTKPTKVDFDRSDRELARIFVEMFQPVGSDRIIVAFNDIELAENAKQQWKDNGMCRIMSLDRRKKFSRSGGKIKQPQKSKPKGFAAKLAAEMDNDSADSGPFQLPEGTEVAIFVSPDEKEIPVIEKVCQTVGMGTLVILLNARKCTSISNFGTEAAMKLFREEFVTVFHLGSASQDVAPGCLLYHAYTSTNNNSGDDTSPWILARKPKVGQPKTILVAPSMPSIEGCKIAYEDSIEGLSDVEKNVENALENVSKWFR